LPRIGYGGGLSGEVRLAFNGLAPATPSWIISRVGLCPVAR